MMQGKASLVVSEPDGQPTHLCSLINQRLSDFERVRIGMHHICPRILESPHHIPTPFRLINLMIRLSVPFLPKVSYDKPYYPNIDIRRPSLSFNLPEKELYNSMIPVGVDFAMEMKLMLRVISRPDERNSGVGFCVADCVREKALLKQGMCM